MKEQIKIETKKIGTLLLLVILILSVVTISVSVQTQAKVITVGASPLGADSVNSQLNLTLSHLSYSTQPPQFIANSTTYSKNASYTAGSQWVINATYQVFQHNASVTGTTASALSYNFGNYVKSPKYFFSDAKIGLNGTGTSPGFELGFGNASITSTFLTTMATTDTAAENISQANQFWIELNATASGSTYTYNATFVNWYRSGASAKTYQLNYTPFKGSPLLALNMYEIQFNIQNGTQQVSIVYTNNGTTVQDTKATTYSNAQLEPMLNFTHITHGALVFSPTASTSGGMLFDWMYVVDKSTYTYNAVPSIALTSSALAGSYASVNVPFDPTSLTSTSAYQAANATNGASDALVSNNLVSSVTNVTTNSSLQNSIGMNNSQTTSYASDMSGSNMIANSVYSNVSNMSVKTNEQASTWNSQYVNSVLLSFLENYASAKATAEMKAFVPSKDITIISDRIGSMEIDTNYSAAAATAIRDYIANTYASIYSANNMSVVNPTTGAIVAGAGAGAFYSAGLAVMPTISHGMIISPLNGHAYTIQSAGFYSGAYISGGAVIVPQYKLMGWEYGSPVFAVTSGFGFGSIFSSLTSGGSAIANLAQSSSPTITNGFGTVAKVVDNNVVKPLNSGPVASAVQNDVSNTISSAVGITGLIDQNVQGAISTGNALTSGSLNTIKGNLASTASSGATAILSGYHGFKTGIYSIGASVNSQVSGVGNGLNGIHNALVNTAGKDTSIANDALSTVYTRADNFIAGSSANFFTTVRGAANTSLSTMNAIGNTYSQIGSKTSQGFNTYVTGMGKIANTMLSGTTGFFSSMTGLPSLISHFVVHVVVAVAVVLGLLLMLFFIRHYYSKKGKNSYPEL